VVTTPRLRAALAAARLPVRAAATPNVALAHAWIKQRHAGRDFDAADWDGPVHRSAVVHPPARCWIRARGSNRAW
jgi:hypothetical protein